MRKDGGEMIDMATKETVPIKRKGNLYVINAWIKETKQDFGWQGS